MRLVPTFPFRTRRADTLTLGGADHTRQTVLDVPTGTGASLPLLRERVGPYGRVVGVDYSPGMLSKARSKMTDADSICVSLE